MPAAPDSLAIDVADRRVRLSPKDPAFYADPGGAYRLIREAGLDLFFWEDLGLWCAASHALVNGLFRDRRFGRTTAHLGGTTAPARPAVPDHVAPFYAVDDLSMLENEPPVHTRLRTLVNRAFVTRTVERLRPRVAALAHALIDAFPADQPFDLLPAFAEPIPVRIIADMLGVPLDRTGQLLAWSHAMVAMYRPARTRADEDAATAAAVAFSDYLRELLRERRVRPGEDLLSTLAAAEAAEGRLSEEELVANAILLLNAGHEATVHAIGHAVALLAGGDVPPATRLATPARTSATVEEVLRFAPPLHLFTRYALEPCEVAGAPFTVGDRIGLMIGAANRDAAVFPDPDRFDPDRFDPGRVASPHVAFGAGIHFCIGAPLARLELQVALPILFERMPTLRLAGPAPMADTYHFHGRAALPVRTA